MKISGIGKKLGRDLAGFGALVLAAAGLGFAINHFREAPLPLVYRSKAARLEQAVEAIGRSSQADDPVTTVSGAQIISLDEFKACVAQSGSMILDARPEVLHRLAHVPRALSLPRNDFPAAYARLKFQLESDKNQLLVVYCSDVDCEDSQLVADALLKLGFRKVSLFKGGWAAWTAAHLCEEKSP